MSRSNALIIQLSKKKLTIVPMAKMRTNANIISAKGNSTKKVGSNCLSGWSQRTSIFNEKLKIATVIASGRMVSNPLKKIPEINALARAIIFLTDFFDGNP